MLITQKDLLQLLHYCPETGLFKWHKRDPKYFSKEWMCRRWNHQYANKPAGSHRPSDGYLRISLKPYRDIPKRIYYGHRLACLYMNGHFPLDEMDYIDGNVYNLKWSNLRPATRSQQRMNTKLLKDRNVSGVTGVFWDNTYGKWTAHINADGKTIHLGNFNTFDEAVNARREAENKHFKEYSRFNSRGY